MHIINNFQLEDADDKTDYDYEITSPTKMWSTNANTIPLQSAVQTPRLFYGSRFVNQALPIKGGESPLVQNLDPEDPDGRSFDDILGDYAGNVRSGLDGEVVDVTDNHITLLDPDGNKTQKSLYKNFSFNQKSGQSSRVLVKKGDMVKKNQLLAASDYTDDNGTLNMGLNARVAMVPMRGQSMDDAIVVSQSFANRLKSEQYKTLKKEVDDTSNTSLNHYRSLFPSMFTKEKLATISEDGIVKPGTILKKGDPVILATSPRPINSSATNLGKMSKALSQSRRDSSVVWEEDADAEVTDVRKTKNGWKVITKYTKASKAGDKIVFRQGNKGTISEIMPDDQMPRGMDGSPMEVLLNPLSLYSRANAATAHELALGKAAKKLGRPLKLSSFTKKGETWEDVVDKFMKEAGVESEEKLFDPTTGKYLEAPVATGYGYIQKLHHTSSGKLNHRGTAGYDANMQPIRGGGEGGKAKRMSGLETTSLMSSGAYNILREGSTIRGQKNDAYWRAIRSGKTVPKVGTPFVYHKFQAMLKGAGMQDRDLGGGKRRLAAFTDKDLEALKPIDVENGKTVNLKTFEEEKGGLFDKNLTVGNKWGRIKLPRPIINPAFESAVVDLLGIKRKDLESVLYGEKDLKDVMS